MSFSATIQMLKCRSQHPLAALARSEAGIDDVMTMAGVCPASSKPRAVQCILDGDIPGFNRLVGADYQIVVSRWKDWDAWECIREIASKEKPCPTP